MDGWIQEDDLINVQKNGGGWMGGWKNRWMGGWMEEWIDGLIDGWKND